MDYKRTRLRLRREFIHCFGEQRPPRSQALALARLFCFSFSFCSSPFCFLLTVFHDTFSKSYTILTILCLLILSPQGTVDGLQVQISQEIHPLFRGVATRGKIGLSYSLGLWDFIFSCPLFFFPCSSIISWHLLFLCLISFKQFPCASVW